MTPVLLGILLIIVLAGVGVAGDAALKLAGTGNGLQDKWFAIGLVIYAATAFGWLFALKYLKLSTVGVVYSAATILGLALLGTVYFREQLSTGEMIGIGLGVVSIILLGRFA